MGLPEVGRAPRMAARWDPSQYLRFEAERSQPCRDLIARVLPLAPARIVDLGCGTGTSTALLRAQWPGASTVGVDNSPEMLAAARRAGPEVTWTVADIATWATEAPYDLVFSNAALHWVPDHAALFPRLFAAVAPGGALAVQMPVNGDAPAHRRIREVAGSPRWTDRWPADLPGSHVGPTETYYDALAPMARTVELWRTEYVHVLPDAPAIVEWVKGTTLRPYLTALPTDAERTEFLGEITEGVRAAYPSRPDGSVLFPFRRLFLVARR